MPNFPQLDMKATLGLGLALIFLAAACFLPLTDAQSGWSVRRIVSSGRDLNAVYFTDSKRGWVGGDDGFFSHTEDGGASWREQRIGTRDSINDVYFVNKETGFALAGGSIFSTSDSGSSWQPSHTFTLADFRGAVPELYSLRFNGKKRGWVVGSTSRGDRIADSILAITRDGGASWHLLQAPTHQELIHIDFVDEKHGWIVGADGAILYTEDSGETWTRQTSDTNVTLYHVDFRNKKQGVVVGERGTILATDDGGKSWTKVFSPVRATLLSVQFVSEDDCWIVGRGGTILRSGNGGRTWIEQEGGPKQNLYAMFMTKDRGWAVGSDGLILLYER